MENSKKIKMSSVDLDSVAVLDEKNVHDLLDKFAKKSYEDDAVGVSGHLTRLLREPLSSKGSQDWLEWCNKNSKVKVTHFDVPWGILPHGCTATLYDVKTGGFKGGYGPDDKIYNNDVEIREKVARGNTVLKIHDSEDNLEHFDLVTFALKKFTGGMGDEDEDQPDDGLVWQKYFLKPLEEVTKVVCMMKENGEAAHMSVRLIKGKFFLVAGSKNVHMIFRNQADIDKYTDGRFLVAKSVASAVLDELESMKQAQLSLLLNLMHQARLTACFEILMPNYQHVVDLSYLQKPKLKFITWTEQLGAAAGDSFCAVAPHVALDLAKELGLSSVGYEVVPREGAEMQMEKVRRDYGYEGQVMYFLDENQNTIGLLKKKTAWYVLCRAVREKVSHAYSAYKKEPTKYAKQSEAEKSSRIQKRLKEIQKWLDLTDEETDGWIQRGIMFQDWVIKSSQYNPLIQNTGRIQGVFPQLWAQFLQEKELKDTLDHCQEGVQKGEKVMDVNRSKTADILVWNAKSESPCVVINEDVILVRPYIATCIIRNVSLHGNNCKKVINAQNKLHAGPCKKRTLATIGTHDLCKIQSKTLHYTSLEPSQLMIAPITNSSNEAGDCSADKLIEKGEFKIYSQMLTGKSKYPCLMDDETALSLPPLCNSNKTKLSEDTTDIFVEITSDKDQETVERVMEMLLKQFLHLNIGGPFEGYEGKVLCVEKGRVVGVNGIESNYPLFSEIYSVYQHKQI